MVCQACGWAGQAGHDMPLRTAVYANRMIQGRPDGPPYAPLVYVYIHMYSKQPKRLRENQKKTIKHIKPTFHMLLWVAWVNGIP